MLRLLAVFTFPGLLACQASAADPDLKSALRDCRDLPVETERLRCFDELVDRHLPRESIESDAGIAVEEQPAPVMVEVDPGQPRGDFGLEHKQESNTVESIEGIVAETEKGNFDRLIIRLTNGQVWHQVDQARFRLRPGQSVVIRRGVLNSFFLQAEGSNREVKVRRVR